MNLDDVRKSLMVESLIQNKNGIMTSVNVSVKKQWNIAYMKKIMLGILVYLLMSDKGCEIDECLKECTCTKRLADDLFTCHQIVYIPETAIVNPNSKTNYSVIAIVLLAVTFLQLLVVIVEKYYIKHVLTIPCLWSY